MKSELENPQFVKGLKKKFEEEMTRKEMEILVYWKGEIDKILSRRPDLLAFQLQLQNLVQRIQNRIRILKSSLSN